EIEDELTEDAAIEGAAAVEEAIIEDETAVESTPAVEEALWGPGEEPYRQPPVGKGVIWGRLVDEITAEPALEAEVKVLGTSTVTYTDLDGYYRLELPAGSYTIELFYELYEAASLGNINVQVG